jgi:hypothetical protein
VSRSVTSCNRCWGTRRICAPLPNWPATIQRSRSWLDVFRASSSRVSPVYLNAFACQQVSLDVGLLLLNRLTQRSGLTWEDEQGTRAAFYSLRLTPRSQDRLESLNRITILSDFFPLSADGCGSVRGSLCRDLTRSQIQFRLHDLVLKGVAQLKPELLADSLHAQVFPQDITCQTLELFFAGNLD